MSAGCGRASRVLEEAFMAYDKNGDGEISADELVMTMQALKCNISLAGAQNMIQQYDLDNSGTLELDEFKLMITERRRHKEIFDKLDSDLSGRISREELKKHVKKIKPNLDEKTLDEEVDELISDIDIDGDGQINLKEFSTFLNYLKQCEDAEQQQQ